LEGPWATFKRRGIWRKYKGLGKEAQLWGTRRQFKKGPPKRISHF